MGLSSIASSGLAVVLTVDGSTTNGACGVSGSIVTLVHSGSCVLDANQLGNSDWAAARQVQRTIAVGPASQVIRLVSPSHDTVGASVWLSPLASSGLPVALTVDASTTNGACTVSGSTVTFSHVGLCVLDANQPGDADYAAAAQVQRTITVGQASQKIRFTAPSQGTVGGSVGLMPVASSGLSVTLTIDSSTTNGACTLSGDTVSFKKAGSCVLDANQAGNTDYAATTQVQRQVTVGVP